MAAEEHQQAGIGQLLGRLVRTGLGAFENRVELAAIEWQEERMRLSELFLWLGAFLFLGMMGLLLLTATIIFLFKAELRPYVAGAFTALYFLGAFGAWRRARSHLRQEPFSETRNQTRKDREWLHSLK